MQRKAWKLGQTALAAALAISSSVTSLMPAANPVLAQESNPQSDAARTEDGLRALVTPVLQSYVPDESNADWHLGQGARLVIAASDENIANIRLAEVIKLINAEMADKGLIAAPMAMVYSDPASITPEDIVVDLADSVTEESNSPEAYRIEIGLEGIRITGASENAVLNALHTIEQLAQRDGTVPYGVITDYPNVKERRLHVDCARKYISKDWFIRQIHEMSYLKMNALQMHFSENLGFRIECETDPAIMSDEYLTKDEVREILAEARKYGVSVIPSFDSPGHVDQILRAHPEYGQVSSSGSHYASGLDITNEEAVSYIKSLYAEYMDLFEGCTDIHIGGDEYMEFDRAPFTTQYQSVLNAFAQEKYGAGYTWKDAIAGYINDLAEFCHERGFTPRIFNDGIYYGESSYSTANNQKIIMHDYIGIDFWSQMSWNYSIARLNTFVNHGHDTIYNLNASYFYYVLRSSMPSDGRLQHSFDNLDPDKLIYSNWTPGQFQANTVSDNADYIKGAGIAIWCDVPNLCGEDVIHDDVENALRALASKSWNVSSPQVKSWEDFQNDFDVLGHAGAYEKGTKLSDPGEILAADSLSKVVLHYQLADGTALKADSVRYGSLGDAFNFAPDAIYGCRLIEGSAAGVFSEETQEFTFVYEKYTDLSLLQDAVDHALEEPRYIASTFAGYKSALIAARSVLANPDVWQKDADDAFAALQAAASQCVLLSDLVLYAEVSHPLPSSAYISGYPAYQQAVEAAREVLFDPSAQPAEKQAALDAIQAAAASLMKPDGNTPTVEATHNYYEPSTWNPTGQYSYAKMLDGDLNTKCWFGQPQSVDAVIDFTFPSIVNMSAIHVSQPDNDDYLRSADVMISSDGETWTTVGSITGRDEIDKEITFAKTPVLKVRIQLKTKADYWYQINEVMFTYEQIEEDTSFADLLGEAALIDLEGKTYDSASAFADAYLAARALYASGLPDENGTLDALRQAIANLKSADDQIVEADFTLLQMAVDYAEAQAAAGALEHLHPLVAARFASALEQAKTILEEKTASQQEADAAWMELSYAIHLLGFKADKSALQQLVDQADALDLRSYEDGEAKDAFLAALQHAKDILGSDTALDNSIEQAARDLAAAMAGLQAKDIDTRMLAWLIDEVDSADLEDFCNPQPEKDAFAAALAHGKDVLAHPENQQEVDAAAAALNEAWLTLRLKPSEEMLQALRDFAAKAATIDRSLYTKETLAIIDDLAARAKALLENPHAGRREAQELILEIEQNAALLTPANDKSDISVTAGAAKPVRDNTDNKASSVNTAASFGITGSAAAALFSAGLLSWLRRRQKN